MSDPLITNDAVVLGILISILAFLYLKLATVKMFFWKKFYSVVPALLLCYFIPSIFNSLGIISGKIPIFILLPLVIYYHQAWYYLLLALI